MTAIEAFRSKGGNCLSCNHLFVALAAFADSACQRSLSSINRALRLRSRDGRMRYLKGQVELA